MTFPRSFLLLSVVLWPVSLTLAADDAAKTDPRYPFRTDFANANLPWYQPKPLEFPPHHSDRRINGELISADFIHRTGQFRVSKTGEVVEFFMPPYASVHFLKAEADLRDVPLGTDFLFFLNDDGHGNFTRLATMQDQFSIDAGHSFSYKLDEVKLGEGKLLATKQSIPKNQPDLGKAELHVNAATRVWKDDQQIKLEDLKPGDELLYDLTGRSASSPGVCTDIWVGAETHQKVTEAQTAKFAERVKKLGLPGWINKTEGNKVTVTLFSDDVPTFKKTYADDLAVGKDVALCVANEELRTWNPPVDKEKSSIVEVSKVPTESYGCSGTQVVIQVAYMLEGFRRGRVVRVFGSGWTIKDPPYGQGLMNYGYRGPTNSEIQENTAKEYPLQYPYRTDYGNDTLPWFKLKPGQKPPQYSEHRVLGELVKVDAEKHTCQFRTDRTGETVEFTLVPGGSVQYLNANATLADIPIGTRCTFGLYQDHNGAFSQAWTVSDDFSHLASQNTTLRVTALKLDQGRIDVGWQLTKMKNYNGDMELEPDLGQSILLVTPETRVWKGDKQVKLTDLAVGDLLLVDRTSEQSGQPAHCTDIWIGEDTHKAATEQQAKKLATAKK
ncbi:hypothetical protein [Chthoniobacter flavus]|uniref:hypothetical protein n=1 Tax=Chthoniobacter flavus TaxID=191863 RepID=UPI00192A7E29|nr:hypothetical protein [Chthoniobacter flavus]